jgi:hypothetical protein
MLGNNKKSIGFNSNFYTNKSDFSPEALTWKTNIINNGGTISDALLTIFDNNFFKPAKANGNILTELDRLNIYCGLVGFEIAARTNMINANHYVTPVSSPTFDQFGYKSSGTSYLNLNYIPSTQAVKLTQTNASIFVVVKEPLYVGNTRIIGCGQASFVNLLALTRTATPDLNASLNGGGSVTNLNTTSIGNVFFAGQRNGTNLKSIINANENTGTSISLGLPNLSAFELSININGSPITSFDAYSHLCSGHGSASLDLQGLRIILNNLFTALGV